MTYFNSLLILFISINLSIALTYIGFKILAKIRSRLSVRHLGFLRLGQLTLVLSIFLPISVSYLPSHSVRQMATVTSLEEFRPIKPAIEGVLGASVLETSQDTAIIASETRAADGGVSLSTLILSGILLSFLVALAILVRNFINLKKLVDSAISIRSLRNVQIAVSDEINVPFSTLATGKAVVLLPSSIIEKHHDMLLAVKHELQHHRQRDTLWVLVTEFFGIGFLLNPFYRAWIKLIGEFQELACDESILSTKCEKRVEYAESLVRAVEMMNSSRAAPMLAAGFIGQGRKKNQIEFLKKRIGEIMIFRKESKMGLRGLAFGLILFAGAVSLVTAATDKSNTGKQFVRSEIKVNEKLQKIVVEELTKGLKSMSSALSGFAVVENPKTGEILAVAQVEGRTGKENEQAFFLSEPFEPMSLMKPLYAAIAIESSATTIDEVHDCENGKYKIDDRYYHDWKPFKKLSTRDAIVNSSSICTLKAVESLGASKLRQGAIDLGFGESGDAMGYPFSTHGFIRKYDSSLDKTFVAHLAYGFHAQYVTPLEMVQAYGAIANGGDLLKPVLYGSPAQKVRTVFSAKTAADIRSALRKTVVSGTGKPANLKKYAPAGKTATSPYGRDVARGSFIGFAPADDPKLVVYVAIHRGDRKTATRGSSHAAPIFREIVKRSLGVL